MPQIVLATLNARYQHVAFGLRSLYANLGDFQSQAVICEFTIQQGTLEIVEAILQRSPAIVGFGVYIWNVAETERVVAALKQLRPNLCVVLGGPEVSYETASQPICALADYVITGEGDLAFAALCREWAEGRGLGAEEQSDRNSAVPQPLALSPQLIHAPVPDLATVKLPYDLYTDEDLAHRVVYVEASRGCPFTCEFCLSALDIPVRQFPLEPFLAAMERLLERGCRTFKFVDRTFNLNVRVSRTILQFFLDRYSPGLFLHFEMIPDRLPEGLRELIVQFPPGALQFEVGIQTWNDDAAELISRRQDNAVAEENLRWLHAETGVHVHADLIVGLPGEDVDSFGRGFDRLAALRPQEIQVGILKRLRGTPIIRHDDAWHMIYSPHPPYEILQNRLIDFETMQELRRFAKTWDLVANSGNFVETTPLFWEDRAGLAAQSPFDSLRSFSRWLYDETGRTHSIALPRLLEMVFRYLTTRRQLEPAEVAPILYRDYRRGGRSDVPTCLREWVTASGHDMEAVSAQGRLRQQRWVAT